MHNSEIANLLSEARFVPWHARRRPPVLCAALLVACFRADNCLLMLERPAPHDIWDLPHGSMTRPDNNLSKLSQLAAHLVYSLSGIRLALPPVPYGYIDWGPQAAQAGWGWTACLYGEIGTMDPLPPGSWARHRTFFNLSDLLAEAPADAWTALRQRAIAAAFDAYEDSRDFWLLQPLDNLPPSEREGAGG